MRHIPAPCVPRSQVLRSPMNQTECPAPHPLMGMCRIQVFPPLLEFFQHARIAFAFPTGMESEEHVLEVGWASA